jgi:hypothetical protein
MDLTKNEPAPSEKLLLVQFDTVQLESEKFEVNSLRAGA